MTISAARENPHGHAWKMFQTNSKDHVLTVLHDDGLYRHLRMAQPGTGIWSWNIITWPGSLCIRGDIGGGHVFTRMDDMLKFFNSHTGMVYGDGSPPINPGYWGEKLEQQTQHAWSPEKFMESVKETLSQLTVHDPDDTLRDAEDMSEYEHDAREWASNTDHFQDLASEAFADYDIHFLFACYAIATTVSAYDAEVSS